MATLEQQLEDPRITPHDRFEVLTFQRFLQLGYKPDEWRLLLRDNPGWALYVLDAGPPPPTGCDQLPITAWTLPG